MSIHLKFLSILGILLPVTAHADGTTSGSQKNSPSVYVVGDSISTPTSWPQKLAALTGRHVFSQAIGGTTSPTMVNRTRGVELVSPPPTTAPGAIQMKWNRHLADRTNSPKYKTQWAYYSKAVSEPTRIEVFQDGRPIGQAKRILKNFTTDHASHPKTILSPGHGLKEGDRVTFIGNDPDFPDDLSVMDKQARWDFSSPNLPSAIVERRVYFAANVTDDSFEIKEMAGDAQTLDIGSDSHGSPSLECGWEFDAEGTGGPVTWAARTKYDDRIWLLEVSANDIPVSPVTEVTIPNTNLLLEQMTGPSPRFILVCPPSGSYPDRGPGSFNWKNYYETFMPWVREKHPDNHIDTMALLEAGRTKKELDMLQDPAVPERLWITGKPSDANSWQAFKTATPEAHETWVGPGYTPLQYRVSFTDDIHLSSAGNQAIAEAVSALISKKGWSK